MTERSDAAEVKEFLLRCENLATALSELIIAIALVPEMSAYTDALKTELKNLQGNILTYIDAIAHSYTGE